MGTIPATAILDKAAHQLLDEEHVRWTEAELLLYLNDGQRQLIVLRPEVGAVTEVVKLAAGTKQSLPAGGVMLLDVVRNMGLTGTAIGRAIRVTSREVIDSLDPNWHAAKASAVVRNFMHDPRNPLVFYVTPPQPADALSHVEVVYVKTPADVTLSAPIGVDDIYAPTLLDYVLYRAYGKDSEYGAELQLATQHANAFYQSLGIFNKEQLVRNPNVMPMPFNPAVPAAAR